MEITINIPKNNYSIPTEIRQEVVQAICEAFLSGNAWSIFHPYNDGRRTARRVVWLRNGKGVAFGDKTTTFQGDSNYTIRGCEMAAAFDVLRKAGYYIFSVYEYGDWYGYKVYEKPHYRYWDRECSQVYEFTDFID